MMKQAVILAAGEGQRLRPFTVARPKTMLFAAGKPILQYVIEALAKNGVREITIVVGYRREQIFSYFGAGDDFGVNITYAAQDRQLGTAHALRQAKGMVKGEFLVLPGDNLIESGTIAHFVNAAPNSLLVKAVDNPSRYGVVYSDGDKIIRIEEAPSVADSDVINTGIYAFDDSIFEVIGEELALPDVINGLVKANVAVHAVETEGAWLDAVYPWDILRLNSAVLQQLSPSSGGTISANVSINGTVTVGKGTVIHPNTFIQGPVIIGENCVIGPNACILPSTSIGNNVAIAPFSTIGNCVILNDVNIGPGAIIQDSVIDEGCVIDGRFTACSGEAEVKINGEFHRTKLGAMLGTGCIIQSSVTAQAGTILGNYTQVQPMKYISGRLPDKSIVY